MEGINLAGGGACPVEVSDLVVELRRLADEVSPSRPRSAREAHDELLRLSSVVLGRPREEET
jgi:hypothetical protein